MCRLRFGYASLLLSVPFAVACGRHGSEERTAPPPASAPSASIPSPVASTPPAASSSAPVATLPGRTDGCPDGMVRVEGDYCPVVIENCKKHHKEWEENHEKSERCLEYQEPSKCLSKEREHLAFCMDRYEWPNQVGELPRVLTSWLQARKMCEDAGKRLCTEDEFNFACEGPEMLPYVYGYVRNADVCNIDKPYRKRTKKLKHYDACLADPKCREHFESLDQREKIGERTTCVSWAGIYDLNGNVNEWVFLPKEESPNRSGLKGGWWGPVRNRCRPTVTFHKEEDYGYEAGFRCCKDVSPSPTSP